jgi:hypothetical protein
MGWVPRLRRPAMARPAPRGSTGRPGLHRHWQRPAHCAPPASTWRITRMQLQRAKSYFWRYHPAHCALQARTRMRLAPLLFRPALVRPAQQESTGRVGLHRHHQQRPAHCAPPARTWRTRELRSAGTAPPARTRMAWAPLLCQHALVRRAPCWGSTGRPGLHRHQQRPAHCAPPAPSCDRKATRAAETAPPARTRMGWAFFLIIHFLIRPAWVRPAPRGSTGRLGLHRHRQRPAHCAPLARTCPLARSTSHGTKAH